MKVRGPPWQHVKNFHLLHLEGRKSLGSGSGLNLEHSRAPEKVKFLTSTMLYNVPVVMAGNE